jgi:hypothetical protein
VKWEPRTFGNRVADILGLLGFFICAFSFSLDFGIGRHFVTEHTELGLSQIRGVVTDDNGMIFVGLQQDNRVQVYSSMGDFQYGFFVDNLGTVGKSFQGSFGMRVMDNSNILEVVTPRFIYVHEIGGELLNVVPAAERLYQRVLEESENRFRYSYQIHRRYFNPYIVKLAPDGEREILIGPSFWRWAVGDILFGFSIVLLVGIWKLGVHAMERSNNPDVGGGQSKNS